MRPVDETGKPSAQEAMSISDVAALLGVTEHHVRRMVTDGRIPYFRLGPGPRAPIRVWRWALEQAAEINFQPTSRQEEAAQAEAGIAALFARRLGRR